MSAILEWNDTGLLTEVRQAVREAAKEGAEFVAADARRFAPVKTGDLKSQIDIYTSKFKEGGYLVMAQGPGNYNRFYAAHVELGTSDTAAQPFLRPALRKNKRKILKAYEGKLK